MPHLSELHGAATHLAVVAIPLYLAVLLIRRAGRGGEVLVAVEPWVVGGAVAGVALAGITGLLVRGQAETELRGNAIRIGTVHFWLGIAVAVVVARRRGLALAPRPGGPPHAPSRADRGRHRRADRRARPGIPRRAHDLPPRRRHRGRGPVGPDRDRHRAARRRARQGRRSPPRPAGARSPSEGSAARPATATGPRACAARGWPAASSSRSSAASTPTGSSRRRWSPTATSPRSTPTSGR